MTTGSIVVLAVLVLGTRIGLWRRRTDGTFRPVGDPGPSAGARVPLRPRLPASTASAPAEGAGTSNPLGPVLSSGSAPVGSGGAAGVAPDPVLSSGPAPVGRADSMDPASAASSDAAGSSGSGSSRSSEEPAGASAMESGDLAVGEEGTLPIAGAPDAASAGALDAELLARLGVEPARVTLLQFSSAFCAPCRALRRVSGEVAAMVPGVQHVEVDAESHLDVVRQLGIWRTPTLLVLDADGRVVKRATGVPGKPQLIAVLGQVLAD